jgi:predicted ArsR family transcriptional regulator
MLNPEPRSDTAPDAPGGAAPARANANGNGHAPASAVRREILLRLRQQGPATPDQLAEQLGASRSGMLQHLRALESANLVVRETIRHGVGRPRHVYDVTADAQDLFPGNYDGLATGLVKAIAAVGGRELVEQVFEARREQTHQRLHARFVDRRMGSAPLLDRVRELAVFQDELGYLSEAEPGDDGTVRLREHNCAIYHVACDVPAACDAEIALFTEILGAEVIRESHIASGDRCCSYRIREITEAPGRRA